MNKQEKRIARKAAKRKKQQEKRVRQFHRVTETKAVKKIVSGAELKTIKALPPQSHLKQTLAWSRHHEDRQGSWSWGVVRDWGSKLDEQTIVPFLEQYYEKTWAEIKAERVGGGKRRAKNFSYDLSQIKPEAYRRLIELKLDDREDIFRFRMTGSSRLYGVIFAHVFCTVWYDPTHSIYNGKKL